MTNALELDHLVYAVTDLAQACDDFEQALGLAPTAGGRHPGLGTHNAILPLTHRTYLELIARDPETPKHDGVRPFGLDALEHSRLVTWAVRSQDLSADVEAARRRGYDPGLILPMTRDDPEHGVLEWQLTLAPKPVGQGLIPFVIDWGATPHPSTRAGTDASQAGQLIRFSAEHPDPASIASALKALGLAFDLEVENAAAPRLRATLQGPRGRIELD